eukprot:scaffold198115_cov33-Tisochrysis_lutea.AAC.3
MRERAAPAGTAADERWTSALRVIHFRRRGAPSPRDPTTIGAAAAVRATASSRATVALAPRASNVSSSESTQAGTGGAAHAA